MRWNPEGIYMSNWRLRKAGALVPVSKVAGLRGLTAGCQTQGVHLAVHLSDTELGTVTANAQTQEASMHWGPSGWICPVRGPRSGGHRWH